MNKCYILLLLLLSVFLWSACDYTPTPRPHGFYRIEMPQKGYEEYSNAKYAFEYPVYGEVFPDSSLGFNEYWVNVYFPAFNGGFHVTYYPLPDNKIGRDTMLQSLADDSYFFSYKHVDKADGIFAKEYAHSEEKVYGLLYILKGDVASYRQFYVTDSINHFLRASFYLNEEPNKDSLAPVINFLGDEMIHTMETFRWQ